MKNLIITGGNANYFSFLKGFVKSLRINAQCKDKVVVCDNTISGNWNKPKKIQKGGSFNQEQRDFFKEHDVEVILFSDLLREFNVKDGDIKKIKTGHWAYPAKYLYCNFIASKFKNSVDRIGFFDADIYFQKDINSIFQQITEDKIYLKDEGEINRNSSYMMEWLSFSKKHLKWNNFDVCDLKDEKIICTGFFAGKTEVFLKVTNLMCLLSFNPIMPFHNDQPAMNYLVHGYDFPYVNIGKEVMHMAQVKTEDLEFNSERKIFLVNNEIPTVVHYHGPHRNLIASNVLENYQEKKYIPPGLAKKVMIKLNQQFSK